MKKSNRYTDEEIDFIKFLAVAGWIGFLALVFIILTSSSNPTVSTPVKAHDSLIHQWVATNTPHK